jgi:hypothetical protein
MPTSRNAPNWLALILALLALYPPNVVDADPPLPCKTPLAAPFSKRKAFVASDGLLQSLLPSPRLEGMGARPRGVSLRVLLDGRGPWQNHKQWLVIDQTPVVVTRFEWPGAAMEQHTLAAVPESGGFWLRVQLQNTGDRPATFHLVSLVENAGKLRARRERFLSGEDGKPVLRLVSRGKVETVFPSEEQLSRRPAVVSLGHTVDLAPGESEHFDLQLPGDPVGSWEDAFGEASLGWRKRLAPATRFDLPDPALQLAADACVRQVLAMIEPRRRTARVLKGLEHYYGSNPYDTFQATRALDAVGLRKEADELVRHQMGRLRPSGIFEMWERDDPDPAAVDQWIVQGLAGLSLWNHYQSQPNDSWLKGIAPVLVDAARATAQARTRNPGPVRQGAVELAGLLPPCAGDGGLGHGYHFAQNAGPLAGIRVAAEAVARLKLPDAQWLSREAADFQRAFDEARLRAVQANGGKMIPAYPGATGAAATRPLWGVVMSVTAFDAIAANDPAALQTLRFLQQHKDHGLHLNLGYSAGVWPYMSASVAEWHLRLGEFDEAWRILRAIVDHASPTVCWYEEQTREPPKGYGDPADVWAAAAVLYLTRQLMVYESQGRLYLCPGMPVEWVRPGRQVQVLNAPTRWGSCSYRIGFTERGADAIVELPGPRRPEEVHVCLSATDESAFKAVDVQGARATTWNHRDLVLLQPSQRVMVIARR